jgi:hypothetical protein
VLLGDGRGAFPVVRDLSTRADRSYAGLLVDVDRDGDLDVVISNDSPDPKIVHVNDGTGRFTVGSTYGQSTWVTRNAAVADMNGDSGREFREVRFGDNKGTVYGFATGDVNKDGRTDIAVARSGAQNMLYLGISR